MSAPQAAPRCQTGGRVLKDRRDEELGRRLAGERFVLWRGDHDFSHFERDAPRVMRFYANALETCD